MSKQALGETLSIKMNWKGALHMCLAIIASADSEGRKKARLELEHMAAVADNALDLFDSLIECVKELSQYDLANDTGSLSEKARVNAINNANKAIAKARRGK